MFQPLRENALRRAAARQVGALAFAGLLAIPLLATQPSEPASARTGTLPPSVSGAARVIDGDTLLIGNVRIRLEGVDAPELDQTCAKAGMMAKWMLSSWKCGREAAAYVERLVRDREVRCDSRGSDAYGRMLAVCAVAGLEINGDLVRQGLAWAFVKYSSRYSSIEADARAAKRGVWQAETKPAWVWRSERWTAAQPEKRADTGDNCLIKGNITRNGHVYHMPWDRWYDKTRVETAKGERWFCTVAEAEAAGWRPAAVH